MSSLDIFLSQVVVLLASAVVVMLVSGRLHVPPIVALLATGVLIGPHGLGWISSVREVELFAEVGVALLLFTIGLEVSIDRLRKLRRALLLGGSVQVSLTTVVVTGAAVGLGLPWLHALFIGWVVSLSSTALVLKLLSDRRETETPHGQLALAILLCQDFLIVPMIVLTPFLAGTLGFSIGAFLGRLAGAVAALAVVFLIGRRLLPRLLEVVVRSGAREVLPLGALALCLGIGWLTHSFGFSLAIGSFLAGVLLAGSLYSHQVIADIAPFRDLFSSIFFISIGMLLDVGWVAARPGTVIAVAAGMIALKIVTAGTAVAVLGYPVRTVVLSALSLAQVGEFSFVLMEVGLENGLLIGGRFQLLLAAAVVTLLATPLVVTVSHRLSAWLGGLVPSRRATATQQPTEGEKSDHVIIVGFGVGGRLLARVLREGGIPYIVVELSGELVRSGRREDEPMLYGDATREEILRRAGIERANVVAFAISDIAAVLLGVGLARRLAPGAQIIVRTRLVSENRRAAGGRCRSGRGGGVRDRDRGLHARAGALPCATQYRPSADSRAAGRGLSHAALFVARSHGLASRTRRPRRRHYRRLPAQLRHCRAGPEPARARFAPAHRGHCHSGRARRLVATQPRARPLPRAGRQPGAGGQPPGDRRRVRPPGELRGRPRTS